MTKERFEFLEKNNLLFGLTDDKEVIRRLVDLLIEALYIPVSTNQINVVDPDRIRAFRIDNEAINWGDLQCNEVIKLDTGEYLVTIDEADPDCPTFHEYISNHLSAWGWNCRVQTEW